VIIIHITREGGAVAQLIVRDLEEELVRKLRMRAALHGKSAEAEHREILRQALGRRGMRKTLKRRLLAMPSVGSEKDFVRSRALSF
jgi:plasmid stability protein